MATANDRKSVKFQMMMMSPAEASKLDDYMFANRLRSRAEAIRRLCETAIEAKAADTPITLDELRRRGLDGRAQEVLALLTGERADPAIFGQATREELWAFGFGPLCACGERGLSPWEEADDVCKACREFAEPNGGAA